MNKVLAKMTACCLIVSMILSYAPLAHASKTAEESTILLETVESDSNSLYAGVNNVFSQYIVTSVEINLNHVAEVRANQAAMQAMKEAALEKRIAEAIANSEYSNLGVADVTVALNVRAGASIEAEIVGKLYHHNVATILDEVDGWYKIQSGDVQGYVKAEYVIVGDVEILKSAGTRFAIIKTDALKIHTEASKDADVLATVAKGEELVVVDEVDGWVKVSLENGYGWIAKEDVDCYTEYTHGETMAALQERIRREEEARRAAWAAAAAAAAEEAKKKAEQDAANKTYVNPTGNTGQDVVNYACQFIGNPYVWGGESLTNGVDCSGFVMKVYEAFGVKLPHSSTQLRSVGSRVEVSDMQPGDIVCYSGHVGIYIGNGQIVHASNSRDGIKISNAYYTTILAVRRIF